MQVPPDKRFAEDEIEKLACSDGVDRPIHIWQPTTPKAVMIAVHGGLAHGGDWVTPAQYFKKQGWATVAIDQHGHDGQHKVHIPRFEVFLDDLELLLDWTKTRYPNLPIVILSHSMGALIATHFVLKREKADDTAIKGYIMSSPFYGNKVKVNPILMWLSAPISFLIPRLTAPTESFLDVLTHDETITKRHYEDEKDHIRAAKLSARFGNELMKAQTYLGKNGLSGWNKELFMVVAGDDRLADPKVTEHLVTSIDPKYLEYHLHPDNYHENFNEVNREETFKLITTWLKNRLNLG